MEDSVNQELDLPPEACHYNLRIGGHTYVQGKIKLGVLKHNNGNVLKPLLNEDPRSVRELSFYQHVYENYESDPILCDLKHFIPTFYGTMETTIDTTDIKYLCIEDICGTFEKPCVLEVKIGANVCDPLATEEKIMKEKKKYPFAEIFGFRILGMKVYDHCEQHYTSLDKKFGLSLTTAEAVSAGLGRFVNNNLGPTNCLILAGFLHKLLELKSFFKKQRKFLFISSTILFVYEGNLSPWITWINKTKMQAKISDTYKQSDKKATEGLTSLRYTDTSPIFLNSSAHSEEINYCSDCCLHKTICSQIQNNCTLLRTSMLDFAHVFPTLEEDSNYMFGLNSLISYWQQLLKTSMEMYL